jgi:hypothetical protein
MTDTSLDPGRQLHMRTRRFLAVCDGEECSPAKEQLSRARLNLLWICMNDVIIGVALGSLIRDNRSLFLTVTETFVRVRSDRKSGSKCAHR